MKGHEGVNELAAAIEGIVERRLRRVDALALGTLRADGWLKVDRFNAPFPPGQFYTLHHLTTSDPLTVTAETVVGDHGSHSHSVTRPAELAPLAAGERVLVAWVNDGADPIIVGRVRRTA